MTTVILTGHSDDCIELDGDIREEWNHYSSREDDDGVLVAFSDGTVLRIRFDGPWRIFPVAKGSAELHVEQTTDEDGTDKATLTGDIRWAVLGSHIERAGGTADTPPAAAPKVLIRRTNNGPRTIDILVDGQVVGSTSYHEGGWSGMDAMERVAVAVAQACGATVRKEEPPA